MQRNALVRTFLLALVFALGWGRLPASAAEQAREFLNELRANNLFDVAVDYLDRAKDSPLVSAEFKESLTYERGVTLVRGAHFIRDANLREKQLDEAQAALKDFIAKQPQSPLISAANNELGNLLVQRAGIRVERSKKPNASAQKPALLKEARGMYDEALKIFATMEAQLKTKLEALPKALDPKKDAKQIELRDQLRADYLQTQILTAAVREESAETETKGSKAYNDLLLAAAKDYNEVYEKYRTRLAGMYSRLYQGRCYLKMNNHKEALSYFADLLDQPDQPQEFRDLKLKTLLYAVESWFGSTPKKYDEAIKRVGGFLDTARPDEKRQEDFLKLQLWLAKAYKAQADDLTAREPGKKAEINKALGEARKLGTFVSRAPSEVQEEAKKFVGGLRGGDEAVAEQKPEPKNFAEAKTAGKDAIEAMQTATFVVTELPKQIAAEKDAKVKAELEQQLNQARQDVETQRADALRYFWLALKMVDGETPVEDINVIQYFLCFLHYNLGDLYESALLGEFVARRYPESSGARQCAKIAMASYLKLYKDAKEDDKTFETGRIVGIAEWIVQKWPNEPEAIEAINTLIPFVIREGKLDEAQKYLEKIPEDAAPRGEAELKIGQSLWSTYLRGMQDLRRREQEGELEDAAAKAEKTRLDDVRRRAEKTLSDGVARMQKTAELTPTVATAVLSLGQLYVDTNQAEKAVALLEDEKIGALTLVQRKDPSISKEGLPEETLKTALRAYISSLATLQGAAADTAVNKAKATMDALKETTGGTAEGQKKLVSIYVSLAKDLQSQMEIAPPEVKKSLSKGFETFLKQVGEGSNELNILNWVAETFYAIAASFGSERGTLAPEAKKYYDEADAAFSKMLEMAKRDKSFLTPQMYTQVRHRLAMTKRSLGDYKAAVDKFEEILKENSALLNVQIEAARTYQDWGAKGADAKTRAELYARAMIGAKPNEKNKNENTIWGWGMLAKRTASDEKFRDTFFEARYNLAVCRYRQAEQFKTSDKDKYQKTLQLAKQDVRLTRSLFPELGGETWQPQYNDILKKIQAGLGEKTLGLAELEKADPAPPPSDTPKVVEVASAPTETAPEEGAAKAEPKGKAPEIRRSGPSVLLLVLGGVVCAAIVAVGLFFATRKKPSPLAPRGEPQLAGVAGLDHPKAAEPQFGELASLDKGK